MSMHPAQDLPLGAAPLASELVVLPLTETFVGLHEMSALDGARAMRPTSKVQHVLEAIREIPDEMDDLVQPVILDVVAEVE
eukprot:CAMPEP_0204359458 /NCGR_PEP_ID=MMETSP0469-20131031/37273_1 /ASSEMBLY_ACC=CAM_ASM_000384 /TAXON_ID=2969 /ORGANISM="Oxyrrhis marina" /LENGTH=80 /DNA_ID=CAMNT_0051347489 /DNA_START=11 /DNA_END=250 /DNA_ORIENTATION=+